MLSAIAIAEFLGGAGCINVINNLIKNSQATKKGAAPKKAMVKKKREIQGGGQGMAVMVG